jgi:hypothetical protein
MADEIDDLIQESLQRAIGIYKGSPSDGGKDGIRVSWADYSNPILFTGLNIALQSVSEPIKLAIRCLDGLRTISPTKVSFESTTPELYSFSKNGVDWYEWGSPIIFTESIRDTNSIFWVKGRCLLSEIPAVTRDTKIAIEFEVGSV